MPLAPDGRAANAALAEPDHVEQPVQQAGRRVGQHHRRRRGGPAGSPRRRAARHRRGKVGPSRVKVTPGRTRGGGFGPARPSGRRSGGTRPAGIGSGRGQGEHEVDGRSAGRAAYGAAVLGTGPLDLVEDRVDERAGTMDEGVPGTDQETASGGSHAGWRWVGSVVTGFPGGAVAIAQIVMISSNASRYFRNFRRALPAPVTRHAGGPPFAAPLCG